MAQRKGPAEGLTHKLNIYDTDTRRELAVNGIECDTPRQHILFMFGHLVSRTTFNLCI